MHVDLVLAKGHYLLVISAIWPGKWPVTSCYFQLWYRDKTPHKYSLYNCIHLRSLSIIVISVEFNVILVPCCIPAKTVSRAKSRKKVSSYSRASSCRMKTLKQLLRSGVSEKNIFKLSNRFDVTIGVKSAEDSTKTR